MACKRKETGIGIEGRPASHYIKGKTSIVIGLLLITAGILILLKPEILNILSFGGI
jgi:hypothetical protein